MKNIVALVLLLLLLFGIGLARADQWLPPTPKTYESENGRFRLTVFPRQLAGALPYFEDKVEGREPTGQDPTGQMRCEATLERLKGDHYEQLWRKPLVNDVGPVSALVSSTDGSFITFDNWHSRGWGDDAIVIYSGSGELRKKFKLTDIMSEKDFEKLPRSVSSIDWGGEHYLSYSDSESPIVHLRVLVRKTFERNEIQREFRTVRIRLDTAEIVK
jgi:hypothetical protein